MLHMSRFAQDVTFVHVYICRSGILLGLHQEFMVLFGDSTPPPHSSALGVETSLSLVSSP